MNSVFGKNGKVQLLKYQRREEFWRQSNDKIRQEARYESFPKILVYTFRTALVMLS